MREGEAFARVDLMRAKFFGKRKQKEGERENELGMDILAKVEWRERKNAK